MVEDRLREAMHQKVDGISASADGWTEIRADYTRGAGRRRAGLVAIVAIVGLVVVATAAVLVDRDPGQRVDTGQSVPTPPDGSTATTPSTASSASTPSTQAVQLPEFRDDAARLSESIERLTSRQGRPILASERVYCDLFAALPDINRLDVRHASSFPLEEALTEDRLVEGCLRSDYLNEIGATDSLRAGPHALCSSTQRLVTSDPRATPKVEVETPVIVFNASCADRGYPEAAAGLIAEINLRRRAEINMRAIPSDCPTQEVAAQWVAAVSDQMLGVRVAVSTTRNLNAPCVWPDSVDFGLQTAYTL